MKLPILHNRDLSWLAFNHRVLEEAADPKVPLLERIKFLSIFSSNLDEFYRVRFPAILALHKMNQDNEGVFSRITSYILEQQKRFGAILDGNLIPELKKHHVHFINAEPVPGFLESKVREIFFNHVAGLLQTVFLEEDNFFPVNNRLYMLVVIEKSAGEDRMAVVNIPSSSIPRFYTVNHQKNTYILFLDDIIKCNLSELFPGEKILNCCNFKITRDADLNLNDDFEEDIALKIEKKLQKRDFGLATRFLYQPGISGNHLEKVMELFHLHKGSAVSGGVHHSFKDLFHFPVQRAEWQYAPPQTIELKLKHARLLEVLIERDKMVHTPYHSYNPVLRFFNELAITKEVETIFTTFYRIASDSRIAQALITAARNGKKVFVLVELKARFDEENNLRWSKRMKEAGIKIIYSDQQIKVHAKIALAILNNRSKPYVGLLATGNLNENTAKVYTDHILMTSHNAMLKELHTLFLFLIQKQKPDLTDKLAFKHLLVAQFNLYKKFLWLIDREISNHQKGLPSGITIKLNNLEEESLIKKLYKASKNGVQVKMLVRSICCLRPGVKGMSDNITVKRIVDRYLEHGRIFIFTNAGNPEVFAGSSDWMIRNIYRRIEVCFPIYDESIKKELIDMVNIQLHDNSQAVWIGENGENIPVKKSGKVIRSQEEISSYIQKLNV